MSNKLYDYFQHDIMFIKFFIVLLGVNVKNKKRTTVHIGVLISIKRL